MKRAILAALAALLLVAAKPNDGSCSISPSPAAVDATFVVSASGLPIGSAINLYVTDPNGDREGSPLGSTPDGTFNLNESAPSVGVWTFAFQGADKHNPATTAVYAVCSVDVT